MKITPNISPHKFETGEKFAADAQTTMVCWTDDLDEQDEVSASDTVKYQIPREN